MTSRSSFLESGSSSGILSLQYGTSSFIDTSLVLWATNSVPDPVPSRIVFCLLAQAWPLHPCVCVRKLLLRTVIKENESPFLTADLEHVAKAEFDNRSSLYKYRRWW